MQKPLYNKRSICFVEVLDVGYDLKTNKVCM
jgi:hypothetical protein